MCMDLEKAREEIKEADKGIAKLFVRRMRAVEDVAAYKKEHGLPVYDAAQERRVIERNCEYIEDDIIRDYYTRFLENTMALSRAYQSRLLEGMKTAYTGVEGAFAHIASKRIFPDTNLVSYASFEDSYDAVVRGECDAAVLPIENSYAGEVGPVLDLMYSGSLCVNGVYELPVTQNLLVKKGAALSDIKRVISHPQALSQCDEYIKKNRFRTETESNTALAAKKVAESDDITVAAIASAETAELYGLEVLAENINESAVNTTKFAVFARSKSAPNYKRDNKFILVFTTKHTAGALSRAISVIGEAGFNMVSIHSRPVKETPWQYYFYIEAEGDESSEAGKKMIKELDGVCERLKVVGHYAADINIKDGIGKNEDKN